MNGPNIDAQSHRPVHNPYGAGWGPESEKNGGGEGEALLGCLAAQYVLIAANQHQADYKPDAVSCNVAQVGGARRVQ